MSGASVTEFIGDARAIRRRAAAGRRARADHLRRFRELETDARALRAEGWDVAYLQRAAEIAYRAAISDTRGDP